MAPYWNLRGDGGMLSTVGDMAAFYRALFQIPVRQVVGAVLGLPSPGGPSRAERAQRTNATPPATHRSPPCYAISSPP